MGSAGLGSLALLILCPAEFFLAGRRRIRNKDTDEAPSTAIASSANSVSAPVAVEPSLNLARVTVGDINKERLRRLLDARPSMAVAA